MQALETGNHKPAFSYTIREARESDIPDMVDAFNELVKLEPIEDGVTLGEFSDWYHNPINHAIYVLVHLQGEDESESKLIAHMEFTRNPGDTKAWGWFNVHPDYRLKGVGRALYAEFERRTKETGAETMHITPNSEASLLIEFLERRGFEMDRYFWALRLPPEQPVEDATIPEGITVRTFVPGQDEEVWTHVRNTTFAEHFGSVALTVEELTKLSQEEHFRPEGLFFAFDGDEIAGFCRTGIDPREGERLGYTVGHIHSLGTMPNYRRRGVGRSLLLTGVNYLREHVSVVELGVEGKNASALPLYESVGFRQYRAWANMQKLVPQQ